MAELAVWLSLVISVTVLSVAATLVAAIALLIVACLVVCSGSVVGTAVLVKVWQ